MVAPEFGVDHHGDGSDRKDPEQRGHKLRPVGQGNEDPLPGFDPEPLEPATQPRSQGRDLVVGQGSVVGSNGLPAAMSLPDPVEQEVVGHVEDGLPMAETRNSNQ